MASDLVLSGAVATLLAAVHPVAGMVRSIHARPRRRLLSAAGGISVAYVFVHVLPELASWQRHLAPDGAAAERLLYVVALGGLVVFYGLERLALTSRPEPDREGGLAFRLHVGAFALYNALVGYLLLQGARSAPTDLALFALAMATHLLVNDVGLQAHHGPAYRRVGRWVLMAAPLAGWGIACAERVDLLPRVPAQVPAALFGALAGTVVLTVLKEELPDGRDSRFWPFLLGAVAYAALLLAL